MSNQHYRNAIAKLFGSKNGLGQGEISSLFVDHAVFRFLDEVRRGSNKIEPFIYGWIWNQYALADELVVPDLPTRDFKFRIKYKEEKENLTCSMLFNEDGKIEALICGNYT